MGRNYLLQSKGLAKPSTLCSDNRELDNTGRDSKHVQLVYLLCLLCNPIQSYIIDYFLKRTIIIRSYFE